MSRGVGPDGRPLTSKEEKAIQSLRKLATWWPESLTLFSWSGSLVIFKSDEWQGRSLSATHQSDDANDYIVDRIPGIPNDGGDP